MNYCINPYYLVRDVPIDAVALVVKLEGIRVDVFLKLPVLKRFWGLSVIATFIFVFMVNLLKLPLLSYVLLRDSVI